MWPGLYSGYPASVSWLQGEKGVGNTLVRDVEAAVREREGEGEGGSVSVTRRPT